jgi:type I restriction enzyme, R subunit
VQTDSFSGGYQKPGEQAEQEFMKYTPSDDNRKFTELYPVQRLQSNYIAPDNKVCISTIQRLYSMMKGEELDVSRGGRESQ